jgi:hypothetical protein
MIAMKASTPPTTPPITPLETEDELELGGGVADGVGVTEESVEGLALTDVFDADEEVLDAISALSAPKYAICSGSSMNAGSSLPSGHVALFSHGLALQQPQNDGPAKQVQKSVLPPQVPPGDWL